MTKVASFHPGFVAKIRIDDVLDLEK